MVKINSGRISTFPICNKDIIEENRIINTYVKKIILVMHAMFVMDGIIKFQLDYCVMYSLFKYFQ